MMTVKTRKTTQKVNGKTVEDNEYDIPESLISLVDGLFKAPAKDDKADALKEAVVGLYERIEEEDSRRRVRAFARRIGTTHWSEEDK